MKLFGQLKEALLEKIAGDKPGSVEGQIWYDTVSKVSKYRDDVAVRENVNTNSVQNVSNKTISTSTVQTSTLINNSIEIPTRSDVKSGTTLSLEAYAATATSGQLVYSIDELLFYGIVSNALVPLGGSGGAFTAVDTTAVINALPREEGTLYYATDTDKIWADNGVALFEIQADTPLFSGADGSLHILNGQTVNINAGDIKDYTDVTIDLGGTLNLTDSGNTGNLVQLYSVGPMVINGQIIGRDTGISSDLIKSLVSYTGKNISYTYFRKGGGNGGQAGTAGNGGLGGQEVGGGGGAFGAGGAINANGIPGNYPAGTGGTGTGQNGGNGSTTTGGVGGNGGGGGGGGGNWFQYLTIITSYAGGGGGGAGPYKKHGAALLLGCTDISGTGNIYLSGVTGVKGGNGGTGPSSINTHGAGGGGGSCGGNGGHLFIEGTSTVAYSISGGAAGAGGSGGASYGFGVVGTSGTAGPAGNVGTFTSI